MSETVEIGTVAFEDAALCALVRRLIEACVDSGVGAVKSYVVLLNAAGIVAEDCFPDNTEHWTRGAQAVIDNVMRQRRQQRLLAGAAQGRA